ncbi:MAG: hypothetical protein OXG15_08655 [Gammaproteobacteria bacterium]|nr:hypothetical protein [Gammaproteobacteria bacterium]
MKFVNMKLNVLVPFIVVTLVSLGCSTLDPESQSDQGVTEAENVIEIECGARTFEVQIDKLTPEQEEQLEEFKTRCRIDNVAYKLRTPSGITRTYEKHEIKPKKPTGR